MALDDAEGVCSGEADATGVFCCSGDGDSSSAGDCSGLSEGDGSGVSDGVGEGLGDRVGLGRGECADFGFGEALDRGVGVGECFFVLVAEVDFFFFGAGVGVPVINSFTFPMKSLDAQVALPARPTSNTATATIFEARFIPLSRQAPAEQPCSSAYLLPGSQSGNSR